MLQRRAELVVLQHHLWRFRRRLFPRGKHLGAIRQIADNNLQISVARDASNPEEVEITSQGQPEHEAMTEAETAELESQVSDMVSEGNPNNQDTAETDGGAADAGGGGDGGGDSGGGDGGGGDGGGD